MKRTTKIGLLVAAVLALAAGATAWAFGPGPHGRGGHHGFMKKFVSTAIDDALDEAKVTPQQRDAIHASRDRAFATIEEHMKGGHRQHMDEVLDLFVADRVDTAKIDALRAEREAEMRQVGDAITRAVVEAHDVLTPEQRRVVADYVRSHRPGHFDRAE